MVIASSATIFEDNKILLIKRSNYTNEFPNYWACPGGRAEEGETPEQNVIREVKEETGLDFEPTELLKTGQYKDRELYRFNGTWSGKINIQEEEIADWGWFSYRDATKLDLAFDYRDIIEIVHNKKYLL